MRVMGGDVWRRVTYGVEHEATISIKAYLALVSMGLRFVLAFGYFLGLKGIRANVE